jgi:hypothetical protein
MRFCGLGPGYAVPDANTLWDFREALIAAGALDALFARLDRACDIDQNCRDGLPSAGTSGSLGGGMWCGGPG